MAGVIWQVLQSVPEIGLHTTLRNVVNRADPHDLRTADGKPNPEFKDTLREATYEQIGDDRMKLILNASMPLGGWTKSASSRKASYPPSDGTITFIGTARIGCGCISRWRTMLDRRSPSGAG